MMVPFAMETSTAGGVIRLILGGEVDLAAVEPIRDRVNTYLDSAAVSGIVVDLTAVTFLNSAGISALVAGFRAACTLEKSFHIVNASGRVRSVLDVTGVQTLLGGDDTGAAPTTVE